MVAVRVLRTGLASAADVPPSQRAGRLPNLRDTDGARNRARASAERRCRRRRPSVGARGDTRVTSGEQALSGAIRSHRRLARPPALARRGCPVDHVSKTYSRLPLLILQEVRERPTRSTRPRAASGRSAAVTACGLGPHPVPMMKWPMWWLIRFRVHDRGPTAKRRSTQRGEYLSVELGLGVSHGWSQPGAAGTTKVDAPCRHHVTRLAIRIQRCYLSDPSH